MNRPLAIVTDIEGTTSSIDFVHQVLFPYARQELPDYLREHARDAETARLLDEVRKAAGAPLNDIDAVIDTLTQWIDEDRKVTALKALQGLMWQHGYRNGDFTGHVYDDAVRKLRQWAGQGIKLYVYSSGSVHAQQLLFGYSVAGDLRPLFSGYFDTNIGGKRDADAYRGIAEHIDIAPGDILFLSDVAPELDAAAAAGMRTVHIVRDRNIAHGGHAVAHDFDGVIF